MTDTVAPSPLARYGALWLGVPREWLALFLGFVVAAVAFGLTVGFFSAAAGSIVTVVFGILFLVVAMYVARASGAAELAFVRIAGRPAITPPRWAAIGGPGFRGWLRRVAGNRHAWLYLVHGLFFFPLALTTFVLASVWVGVGFGGATAFAWGGFVTDTSGFSPSEWLLGRFEVGGLVPPPLGFLGAVDSRTADLILQTIVGAIFLLTLPWVMRGLSWANWGVDRLLLGTFREAELEREVSELSASRTAAVAAEGSALRRLERDIHDGPQQRLVRMQMDLAAADRALERDPEAARELVGGALQQSRDALEELRALSRGFAPPILLDRGLVPALESLAVRSPVPTRIDARLPEGLDLPAELARNLYFIAAEALTNVAKHAPQASATVTLATRAAGDPERTWVDLEIRDDGPGGAGSVAGHGLEGLAERAHGQGGQLEVDSPAGWGTRVTARLPLA